MGVAAGSQTGIPAPHAGMLPQGRPEDFPMSSKMVMRQYDRTAFAAGAAFENAPVVGARLSRILPAAANGDGPSAEWEASMRQVGHLLQDAAASLQRAGAENEQARTRQVQLRELRDQAAAKVRGELRSLRFLFDELFGKEKSLRLFPARRELPTATAQALLESARELAELLRSNRVEWPAQPVGRHLVPPAELAASLEASTAELAAPVEALRPKKSGGDVSRNLKNSELAAAADLMRRGNDFLFGVYRLAGLDEAAANLRPAPPRRRSKEEEPAGQAAEIETVPLSSPPAPLTALALVD